MKTTEYDNNAYRRATADSSKKAKGKKGKGKRYWGWERRWLRRVLDWVLSQS